MTSKNRTRAEVVADFNLTRDRHHGRVAEAAALMNMTPSALDRALFRAKAAGVDVDFVSYTRPNKNRKRTPVTDVVEATPTYNPESLAAS
jgi:hypothetical protein